VNISKQHLLDMAGAVNVSKAGLILNDLHGLFALDPACKKVPVNFMINGI
jgi:hypothetical protein